MNKEKLVAVYQAKGEAEANIINGLLESNEINCLLESDVAPSLHVFSFGGVGGVKVMVKESLAKEATNLIARENYV
jgi:hypothetical protein